MASDPIVTVRFQAQEWVNDYPAPADRDPNSAIFKVALSTVTEIPQEDWPGSEEDYIDLLPKDDSLQSDILAEHPEAPDWVTDWVDKSRGPFYVETELTDE